jgi:acetyltransferase
MYRLQDFESTTPPTARADRYPTALIDVWHASGGERLMLRPVLPQDVRLLEDLIRRSSASTRYGRFHGAVNELPWDVLREMTEVDYRQHMALVVAWMRADSEVVVADGRYSVDASGQNAEFAVIVEDGWQRRGLGRRVVGALADAATRAGVGRFHGAVLRGNVAMVSLLHCCGFREAAGAEDPRTVSFEKALTERKRPALSASLNPFAPIACAGHTS